MPRADAWIRVAVVGGLALAAGCYTESTIDQVKRPPAKGSATSGRAKTSPSASRRAGAPKPSRAEDAKAKDLARQTAQYRDRVKKGQTSPGSTAPPAKAKAAPPSSKPSAEARKPAGKPRVPPSALPSEEKRAAHVADDSFEAGKVTAMTPAKTTGTSAPPAKASKTTTKPGASRPWARPPARPTAKTPKGQTTPSQALPKVSAPKTAGDAAKAPKPPDSTQGAKPEPETPKAAAKPKKAPAPPRPKQVSQPKPQAPSPKVKPDASPAAADKAKDASSGKFVVPKPPEIPPALPKSTPQEAKKTTKRPPAQPRVAVRPRQTSKGKAKPSKGAQPNRPARTVASAQQGIKQAIDQKLKEVKANPNDLDKQMALRLLYLADNQPTAAMAEIPGTNAQVQQFIEKLVQINIAASAGKTRDPATAATKVLPHVEALRKVVMRHADLEIASLKFCTKVERFGVYEEMKQLRFPTGVRNRTIVYCEIKNFTSVPTEDQQYRVLLAQKIKILNKQGQTVHETADDDVPCVSRRPVEDLFLVQLVDLPVNLSPGKYILRVYVEDKLAAKAREGQVEFEVVRSPRTG